MKKLLAIILCLSFMISITGCSLKKDKVEAPMVSTSVLVEEEIIDVLSLEKESCFRFLWEQSNSTIGSPGYGLTRDRYPGSSGIASTASTGFSLTAIPIGIENGYITMEEGKQRAELTLDTLLNLENVNGFFYHFLNMETGKREWNSEASVIDTAILMNGVLFVGEYFGDEIKEKAGKLYEQVQWDWYVNKDRDMFYMSYTPENGFAGAWDFYAEQLMIYLLGAGSPTYPIDKSTYYTFTRKEGKYKELEPFVHSWFGSLFTYQYSHAWVDFRDLVDEKDMNWFDNSVIATKAARQFAIDNKDKFKTFSENSWGTTACDTPKGYSGLIGTPPSGLNDDAHFVDGTVAPSGAAGSIVFTPEESKRALVYYYNEYPELWGKYGFKDAFNLEGIKGWYAADVIGIDKGITLLMLENNETGFVWETFMQNKYMKDGLEKLGIIERK